MRDTRRDLVVVACAVSSGIHAALVPHHLEHGVAAGLGFAVSAALLAVLAAGLARRPSSLFLDGAIVVLGGLIAAYVMAATTGVPVLQSEPEPIDGLGVATKGVEALGLLVALYLKGIPWPRRTPTVRYHSR